MTGLPLAIDRLRAAVTGDDDFEREIGVGGNAFDDAKALLVAYDEQKVEIERLRTALLALYEWYDRDAVRCGAAFEVFEAHRSTLSRPDRVSIENAGDNQ